MSREPSNDPIEAVVRRLRLLKHVRDPIRYGSDCLMFPYFGGGIRRAKKLIVIQEPDGRWTARAGIRVLATDEPYWTVWGGGADITIKKLDIAIQYQFNTIEAFRKKSSLLREDGPKITAIVIGKIGPVAGEMTGWLATRWMLEVPWIEGTGWEWWSMASRDIEERMTKEQTPPKQRFLIRSATFGAFQSVVQMVGRR